MLALYRSGRQAEALQAYRDARAALVEELGIDPGRKLQELEQAILRQDPSLEVRTQSARPGRRAAGSFVGRDREIEELSAALDDAAAGRRRLFLVSGESGLGKSRLADEVASRAKDAGLRVLWGRGARDEGAPPYWLWAQALRLLTAELPELDATKRGDARFRLFVDVASALRAASRAQPLFLVLDDLHDADEPSLLLLDFLAGELAEMHVAIVGTYVDDETTPAHSQRWRPTLRTIACACGRSRSETSSVSWRWPARKKPTPPRFTPRPAATRGSSGSESASPPWTASAPRRPRRRPRAPRG
jgi:AAA ATPase domain/Bacterial transcriptional activator domain